MVEQEGPIRQAGQRILERSPHQLVLARLAVERPPDHVRDRLEEAGLLLGERAIAELALGQDRMVGAGTLADADAQPAA